MSFRVRCNYCNGVATILSSEFECQEFKKFYCQCQNPECGHGFVMVLTFSHTIHPSNLVIPKEVLKKLGKLNRAQQKELFSSPSSAI